MKVTCISEKGKPDGLPDELWVKFGEEYIITTVIETPAGGMIFKLLNMPIEKYYCAHGYDSSLFISSREFLNYTNGLQQQLNSIFNERKN